MASQERPEDCYAWCDHREGGPHISRGAAVPAADAAVLPAVTVFVVEGTRPADGPQVMIRRLDGGSGLILSLSNAAGLARVLEPVAPAVAAALRETLALLEPSALLPGGTS